MMRKASIFGTFSRVIALGLSLSLTTNSIAMMAPLAEPSLAKRSAYVPEAFFQCEALSARGETEPLGGAPASFTAGPTASLNQATSDLVSIPLQPVETLQTDYYTGVARIEQEGRAALRNLMPASYQSAALRDQTSKKLIEDLIRQRQTWPSTDSQNRTGPAQLNDQMHFLIGLHAVLVVLERGIASMNSIDRQRALRNATIDLESLWTHAAQHWEGGVFRSLPSGVSVLTGIHESYNYWLDHAAALIETETENALDERTARFELEQMHEAEKAVSPLSHRERQLEEHLLQPSSARRDQIRTAELETLLVQSHSALSRSLVLLGDYAQARQEFIVSIQRDNEVLAQESSRRMQRALQDIHSSLSGFPLASEWIASMDSEWDDIRSALAFIGPTFVDHPNSKVAVRKLAAQLEESKLRPTPAVVVTMAGINAQSVTDAWWSEFVSSLRAQAVMDILSRRSISQEHSRQIFHAYLLQEVRQGTISARAAREWWSHSPEFGPTQAREMVEAFRDGVNHAEPMVAPTVSQASALVTAPAARTQSWLIRHRVPVTLAAMIVVFVGVGVVLWNTLTGISFQEILGIGVSLDAQPNAGSSISSLLPEVDFAKKLQEAHSLAQGPNQNPAQVARERQIVTRELHRVTARKTQWESRLKAANDRAGKTKEQMEAVLHRASERMEESRQNREHARKPIETKKAQDLFHHATEAVHPAVNTQPSKETMSEASAQKMASSLNVNPLGIDALGPRQVRFTFDKPFYGLVRVGSSEVYDPDHMMWSPGAEQFFDAPTMQGAPVSYSVGYAATHPFAPIIRSDGHVPVPGSVKLSQSNAKGRIVIDQKGDYFMEITGADFSKPLRAQFDWAETTDSSWRQVRPGPHAIDTMDTFPPETDTQLAIDHARDLPFAKQLDYILHWVIDHFEQTIDPAHDARHRTPQGHYVRNIDRDKVTLTLRDGTQQEFRVGICNTSATFAADMLRRMGYPVRFVSGYSPGGSTELDAWNGHAWIEVFSPAGYWVRLDTALWDRVPNGLEGQFKEPHFPEAESHPDPQAQRLHEDAKKLELNLAHEQTTVSDLDSKVQKLSTEQEQLEQKLHSLETIHEKALTDEMPIAHALNEEFIRQDQRMAKGAKANPKALVRELLDPARGFNFIRAQLEKGQVPKRYQVRFLAGVLELAMKHLPREDAKLLRPAYLDVLTEWLKLPDANRPVIFAGSWVEETATDGLAAPSSAPNTQRAAQNSVDNWDVSNSWPLKVADAPAGSLDHFASPNLPITPTRKRVLGIQDARGGIHGWINENELTAVLDRHANPVLFPTMTFGEWGPVIDDGLGTVFGFVSNMQSTKLVNVMTGETIKEISELPVPDQVFIDSERALWFITSKPDRRIMTISLVDKSIQKTGRVSNDYRLVKINGRIYGYTQNQKNERGSPFFNVLEDEKAGTVIKLVENPVDAKIQVLAHPKTGKPVVVDFNSPMAGVDGLEAPLRGLYSQAQTPVFDESGQWYTLVKRKGSSTWDMIGNGSLQFVLPIDVYSDSVQLLGVSNKIAYFLQENGPGPTRDTRTVVLGFASDKGSGVSSTVVISKNPSDLLVSNGRLYFRTFSSGKWEMVRQSQNVSSNGNVQADERISAPEANDITVPFLVNGAVIFAEKIGDTWHWRNADSPMVFDVKVHAVGPQPGHMVISAQIGKRHRFFEVNGGTARQLSEDGEDVTDPVVGHDGQIFYVVPANDNSLYGKLINAQTHQRLAVNIPTTSGGYEILNVRGAATDRKGDIYYFATVRESAYRTLVLSLTKNEVVKVIPGMIEHGSLYFSPSNQGYLLDAYGSIHPFTGSTPITEQVRQIFYGPDGTDYVLTLSNQILRIRDGAKMSPDGMEVESPLFFRPNGQGIYLGHLTRTRDPNRVNAVYAIGESPSITLQVSDPRITYITNFAVGPDGTMSYHGVFQNSPVHARQFGSVAELHNSDSGNDTDLDWEFLPQTDTGVAWRPIKSNPKRFEPVLLHRDEMVPISPQIYRDIDTYGQPKRSSGIRTGPVHGAVMEISGDNGTFADILDPNQELDMLIDRVIQTAQEFPTYPSTEGDRPAFLITQAWEDLQKALVNAHQMPHPSPRRMVQLYWLTGYDSDFAGIHSVMAEYLSKIQNQPEALQEARAELANILTRTFWEYGQRNGSRPFNPGGVRSAGFFSDLINQRLELWHSVGFPYRFTESPARILLYVNRRAAAMTAEFPGLMLSPQDVPEVWMDNFTLIKRWVWESLHHPTMLFAWLMGLSAIVAMYIERKEREILRHFAPFLMHWSTEMDRTVMFHRKIWAHFSFEETINAVNFPAAERARLMPYAKGFRNESPSIQAAAMLLLRDKKMSPRTQTWRQYYGRWFSIVFAIRAARRATILADKWRLLVDKEIYGPRGPQPVVHDTVSQAQFFAALRPIKANLRRQLGQSA